MRNIPFLKILYKSLNILRLLNIFGYLFALFYFDLYFYNEFVGVAIGLYILVFIILLFNLKSKKVCFIFEYLATFAVFNINCFTFGFTNKTVISSIICCFDFTCLIVTDFIYPTLNVQTIIPTVEPLIENKTVEIFLNVSEYKCENHLSEECDNCICIICLTTMDKEVVGNNNCKHYFHYKCITEYITKCSLIKFVCPICRN